MGVLVLGGMAALAFLLTRLFGGSGQMAVLVWFGSCGLALAFPLLAVAVALQVFRSIATPLADVMAAADAVAEGDLDRARGMLPETISLLDRTAKSRALHPSAADRHKSRLTKYLEKAASSS